MFRLALSRAVAQSKLSPTSSSLKWISVRSLCSGLPDFKLIRMPALSPTMEVGTIQEWKKKEGDPIEGGEVLAEIETDKATRSYEVNDDGFIAKVFIEEGATDVPVGKPLAIIVEEESDISAFKDYNPQDDAAASTSEPAAEQPVAAAPEPVTPAPAAPAPSAPAVGAPATPAPGGRVIASPLARMMADSAGLKLSEIAGTGPNGRVIAADIATALSTASVTTSTATAITHTVVPTSAGVGMPVYTDAEVTKYQRVAAERLLLSKTTVPHYYLTMECDVNEMLRVRKQINEREARTNGSKVSVNDFVIKAAASALRKVPQVNSQWVTTADNKNVIRTFHSSDISIAVQTDNGLITPIVKEADRKGLKEISSSVKTLVGKAKDNALAPEEFMGGTFTISNLGMFGINSFCAIVNPPQAAILAVGNSQQRLVLDSDSEKGYAVSNVMSVTLSCDHRVIDGAVGAQWLQEFKACIEDPINIIM